MVDPGEVIYINVGGMIYQTAYATVCKYPDSLIKEVVDKVYEEAKDPVKECFFDRDGHYFRYILNFMRTENLNVEDPLELEALLLEADFYRIEPLKELIPKRLRNPVNEYNLIYRVMNLNHSEIASTLASIGDGWKLVQVIKSEPLLASADEHVKQNTNDQHDYIVILNKKILKSALCTSNEKGTNKIFADKRSIDSL